ncbi:sigma-70 family RNA polymerase sigma factor [Sphingobacterium suaedae]|uniref:Sigma-70 family RNA polymerase sigma factor n=1 Tax=Sphingobacterium suaedae TaxID=1686402 RepID=A0ABW5KPJ0_9SPHI
MTDNVYGTDLEIIEQVLQGDIEQFALLIRRNNPFLYKTARSYGFGHEDAQDLMQDTFVDAYCNLHKFEGRSAFKTWMIKIMLNNCYRKWHTSDFSRMKAATIAEQSIPMFMNGNYNDTGSTVIRNELRLVVEEAVQRIPLAYRMVFSLREISGLNVEETADTLNITAANVKVRLNRAKVMLRKEIEKVYSTGELFEFNLRFCDTMVEAVMDRIRKQ